MKRMFIASLALVASAAAFAQTPSAPAHHNSGKHHKHHHQTHSQHRSGHHDESVGDRAEPLDSAPDFKP